MSRRTLVDLVWIEGRRERWIRFGAVAWETRHDRLRRTVSFEPGAIFGLVRWSANGHGTTESRLDILRVTSPGAAYSTVPHVSPGGESLLRLADWPKVAAALASIDQVEAVGVTAEDACPDHWRNVHHRLVAGLTPRPYTVARHAAWVRRREVGR